MGSNRVSITTTATTEIGLSTKVKAQCRTALTQYAALSTQIKAMQAEQDAIKARVEEAFVEAGETDAILAGADIGGYKVKMVCGMSSRLDKAKLVRLGCDPEWITEATKQEPKKPYLRITAPGETIREE